MPATAMRSLITVLLALLPALPVAAQSDAGKTLRLAPHADLSIVDPHFSGVYITRNFGCLVYDTSLAFDHEFQPRPQMVDTWQVSDDKLTYTFRLRDGLKFHDGQPVRAADAVASLKRWGQRNDAYGQLLLAAASAIEATDDGQIRIVLKQRFPVLEALATMTTPTPFIMPEHAWGSGVLFAASIHVAMAAPNCHILEVSQGYMPMMWELFNEPFDIRPDGMVHAPDRPGLGFTLRADALERFRYVDGPEFKF